MTNKELAKKLYWMANHGLAVNWQDNLALKEAADRLTALGDWALVCEGTPRVLTYEEIAAAPEGAVLWEERLSSDDAEAEPPAPVVRLGGNLHGPDADTVIAPEMCNRFSGRIRDVETGETEETWVVWRWWSARPGEQQRRETPWEAAP